MTNEEKLNQLLKAVLELKRRVETLEKKIGDYHIIVGYDSPENILKEEFDINTIYMQIQGEGEIPEVK